MTIIDADTHLYETRNVWREHTEHSERGKALRIEDDDLGYPWLVLGRRRIEVLGIHQPGDVSQSGSLRTRFLRGLPAGYSYDDMPKAFWDPSARRELLDTSGVDGSVLLPNCGIMWERALADDLEATKVNMSAWNRWAIEVAESSPRLLPVAHLTLRDIDWLDREIAALAAGGVRLAMVAPALVDGRRLSHPDHERAWDAFERHGIAVIFHIAQYEQPFNDAWNEGDPDPTNPLMSSVFMWTAPALAIGDLAARGVLARHPGLRIGVLELMSAWVPLFLAALDGGFKFHSEFNGAPLTRLDEPPSHYVRRQVRFASFPFERPEKLIGLAGDIFMFGSDYPHPEGVVDPLAAFSSASGLTPANAPGFYGENAAWLAGG